MKNQKLFVILVTSLYAFSVVILLFASLFLFSPALLPALIFAFLASSASLVLIILNGKNVPFKKGKQLISFIGSIVVVGGFLFTLLGYIIAYYGSPSTVFPVSLYYFFNTVTLLTLGAQTLLWVDFMVTGLKTKEEPATVTEEQPKEVETAQPVETAKPVEPTDKKKKK
jgi:membrane protease YdiL (CAAX protease family)